MPETCIGHRILLGTKTHLLGAAACITGVIQSHTEGRHRAALGYRERNGIPLGCDPCVLSGCRRVVGIEIAGDGKGTDTDDTHDRRESSLQFPGRQYFICPLVIGHLPPPVDSVSRRWYVPLGIFRERTATVQNCFNKPKKGGIVKKKLWLTKIERGLFLCRIRRSNVWSEIMLPGGLRIMFGVAMAGCSCYSRYGSVP